MASVAESTPAADTDTTGLADERSLAGFLQRVQRRFADRDCREAARCRCRDAQGTALEPDKFALGAPVFDPSDVVDLVPWMRHPDICIRQVAIWAALSRIQFDRSLASSVSVQGPEDKDYHALFLELKHYLRRNKVAYDPAIFDGMYLTVYKYEFPSIVHGRWTEDLGSDRLAFAYDLEVDRDLVTLTRRPVSSSLATRYPSTPRAGKIKDVLVNELGQFVVTVVRDARMNRYEIWPTSDGVLWLREVGGPWTKFRRAP